MSNVLICGYGTVGKPLAEILKGHNILIYDPPKGMTGGEYTKADCVMVCVPCDTMASRRQDLSIIMGVFKHFSALKVPFFVKSSVLPGTCDWLSREFSKEVCSFPEFLTARTALEDIKNQDIICGGNGNPNSYEMLKILFPNKKIISMKNEESELSKFAHNVLGAVKVLFHNPIKQYCDKHGLNYKNVLASYDITPFHNNKYHTLVPGPDGQWGIGGTCFPHNLSALISLLQDEHLPVHLLKACETENAFYRK